MFSGGLLVPLFYPDKHAALFLGDEKMEEVWKAIPGWEGFYEASSIGRVRSIRRLSRLNSKQPERKRWMGGIVKKQTLQKGGYYSVMLTAKGNRVRMPVHRAVLMAFSGFPQDCQITRHLNGNPADNRVDNLAWGSHLENMADRKDHGRYAAGESHVMAKLTNEQALEIYKSDERGIDLAKRFGIHQTIVSDIRRGRIWTDVTGGKPLDSRAGKTPRKSDKMNFQKAAEARLMRSSGSSLKEIAQRFGISEGTAGSVCSGATWRDEK